MEETPLQIHDVWKSFGPTPALRGLSLHVPAQSVYGFLGPNGAGKSTTIRLMLGLQKPDRGTISVFGRRLEPERTDLLARIGSLVEAPSLYGHLTGRENLEVHRRLLDVPMRAIDDALDTVDLIQAADRVVRGYSSGMKQRLGIAQALLGDPELLLLDEPTNGLDPAGIHEIRSLIRDLPQRRGVTLFLSSHLLAEVEQVATHFAIISRGQLKFEGTAEALRAQGRPRVVVEVDRPDRACELLRRSGIPVTVKGRRVAAIPDESTGPAEINRLLVQSGIEVSHLAIQHLTLEDMFWNSLLRQAQRSAMLKRALSAEALKMKRTIALKMVILAPVAVVLLTLFIASQAPFTTLRRNGNADEWGPLIRVNLQFWGLLMLPLYVTLQTALIAGLDHSENQWKALFARPVPRWTIYVAKLIVILAMAAASGAVLISCMVGAAAFLQWLEPDLRLAFPAPVALILRQAAQMTGLAFLSLTIQHWVSLRWRSFSIAVGFGVVAMVAGFAMLLAAGQSGGWPQYFPWSMPMLVVGRQSTSVYPALWIGGALGILASIAGCWDFCRREVQ